MKCGIIHFVNSFVNHKKLTNSCFPSQRYCFAWFWTYSFLHSPHKPLHYYTMVRKLSQENVWKCVGLPNQATLEFQQVHFHTILTTARKNTGLVDYKRTIQCGHLLWLFRLLYLALEVKTWETTCFVIYALCSYRGGIYFLTCRWSLWNVRTEDHKWFQQSKTWSDKQDRDI